MNLRVYTLKKWNMLSTELKTQLADYHLLFTQNCSPPTLFLTKRAALATPSIKHTGARIRVKIRTRAIWEASENYVLSC